MFPVTRGQIATTFALFARAVSRARWRTAIVLFSADLLLTGGASAVQISAPTTTTPIDRSQPTAASLQVPQENSGIQVGHSYHNDVSPALRDLATLRPVPESKRGQEQERRISTGNTDLPYPERIELSGPVTERSSWLRLLGLNMPEPILDFDGISCGGCGTSPRTNGEAGATQYVQVAADLYQVFDKATGVSILGPDNISSLWTGFGGPCQASGLGHTILLYDQLAGRWVITQFAGASGTPTDACVAVSTTTDATGTWYRYAFHLGNNFFAYLRLSVWPDGYYMSLNVFNSSGTTFLGPQPFAFDRTQMIAGLPASFVTPGITSGPDEATYLPADLDGSTMPPAGAPNPFVEFPAQGTYRVFHFHADFTTPPNSTFTLVASPPAAAFTQLCPGSRTCVPQLDTTTMLDGVTNRLMFRLAYRNLGTASVPNESLVGNYSVSSGGVAGVRWFELKNVTSGPVTVAQESTYQPDETWRWLGSAAMDHAGNFAIGYSASSFSIYPQIRYAGRLATDPLNTLAQGEAHLFDGTGSQTGSSDWGDISALTIDPLDDCTFWYTNEYYATTGSSWRTRIGNFRFAGLCDASASPTPTASPMATHFEVIAPSVVVMFNGFNFTVRALDQFNNTVTDYTGTVHFTTTSQQALLPPDGTLTNGFGTFSADLQTPGIQTITATDTVNPSITGTSNDILVLPDMPTPPPSPTPTPPSATPTPTITPTSTPTPTPSSTPAAQPLNLSTRLRVQASDNVGIGGFIVTGNDSKRVLVWGIGPSLIGSGVPDALADPMLELHGPAGFATITNDNWRDTQEAEIIAALGDPHYDDLESAILVTLNPGSYTAILSGKNSTSGVGLIEAYDLNSAIADSKLANISTRAFVDTGSNVVIAGFIIGGNSGDDHVVLRGIGPSLPVSNTLANPTLELHDVNGALLIGNNDWQDDPAQAAIISGAGLAPANPLESGIAATLSPGLYTAIMAGENGGTGVGLVEVYDLAQP